MMDDDAHHNSGERRRNKPEERRRSSMLVTMMAMRRGGAGKPLSPSWIGGDSHSSASLAQSSLSVVVHESKQASKLALSVGARLVVLAMVYSPVPRPPERRQKPPWATAKGTCVAIEYRLEATAASSLLSALDGRIVGLVT